MSKGFDDSGIRRNPAHCSYVLAPRRGTRFRLSRESKLPFSDLYPTIFAAIAGPSPETYDNNCGDAVFRFTPTILTHDITVKSRDAFNSPWSTSCWYCPTPIDWGTIFTNSARGSISLRPIDTAPRTVTSLSGNSLLASGDAEYIDAPLSLTMKTSTLRRKRNDCKNCSVSRLAVPLPNAIASILYTSIKLCIFEADPLIS